MGRVVASGFRYHLEMRARAAGAPVPSRCPSETVSVIIKLRALLVLALGLYTRWYHRWALVSGWIVVIR
jgi:hypothetical protein